MQPVLEVSVWVLLVRGCAGACGLTSFGYCLSCFLREQGVQASDHGLFVRG